MFTDGSVHGSDTMGNVSVLERQFGRASGAAFEAVNATVTRVYRVVGFVSAGLVRAAREVSGLAWDYQDLAGSLRRRDPEATTDGRRPELRLVETKPSA